MNEQFRKLGKPITGDDIGQRLDFYLGKNFRFHSRQQWIDVIRQKTLRINDRLIKPSYRLRKDDEIAYFSPEEHEPEVDTRIRVLWEQDGIMAVYKPSNLPMHEAGAYRLHTFHEVLTKTFGPDWAAVHRLDRETSGIVICSQDKDQRAHLSAKLRERGVEKRYLALAIGEAKEDFWVVDQPIGRSPNTRFRTKQAVCPNGLPSLTTFRVLERKKGFTLLEASPKTGRTHQIRVHAAWSGLPLIGDKNYTPDESVFLDYLEQGFTEKTKEACFFDRMCLHATHIRMSGLNGEPFAIDCPMPDDMNEIWSLL